MLISEVTSDFNITVSVIRGNSSGNFFTKAVFGKSEGLYVEPLMHGTSMINFAAPGLSIDVSAVVDGEYPYFWRNVKIERSEYHGKTYHLIKADGEGVKFNRRKAFRVFVGMPGTISGNSLLGGVNVNVKDISATGVSFIGENNPKKPLCKLGEMINLKYSDDELRAKIDIAARVVRVSDSPAGSVYGATYSKLYPQVEKYVATKQLKNRAAKKNPPKK